MVTILLIDDDPQIQATYAKFLAGEGYRVYQAKDAETAMEFLIRRPVDLVLLDINMAVVGGAEMKEILEAYDESLCVIVSSVYPLTEQKKRISRADDYFDKSHGTEWLSTVIKRVLEKKNSGGSTEGVYFDTPVHKKENKNGQF